jgi:hypothetical protein
MMVIGDLYILITVVWELRYVWEAVRLPSRWLGHVQKAQHSDSLTAPRTNAGPACWRHGGQRVLSWTLSTPNKTMPCVGVEVLTALAMKSNIFCDIMPCSPLKVKRTVGGISPPSSGSKNKPSKKTTWKCLPPALTLVSFSAFSATLEMEEICSCLLSTGYTAVYRRR